MRKCNTECSMRCAAGQQCEHRGARRRGAVSEGTGAVAIAALLKGRKRRARGGGQKKPSALDLMSHADESRARAFRCESGGRI